MEGCITALVTPFNNKKIDFVSFKKLLDYQIDLGIKNFVVNGTTAEAPTLSLSEKRELVKFVLNYTDDSFNIAVGVSSNDTAKMVEEIKNVEDLDFKYLLISTPYYNKTNQEGLIAHITEGLNNTSKEIILYNIPSRAGMQFEIPTLKKLSQHKQIVAIKEASGNIEYAQEVFKNLGSELTIYCGNDDLTFIYYTLGAKGVISAVGNIYGNKYNQMYNYIKEGHLEKAREVNFLIFDLTISLFSDVNPILIKGLLSKLDIVNNELRLPLINANGKVLDDLYIEFKNMEDM